MSDTTNAPIAGAQPPQDASIASAAPVVSQPYSIPAGMTPEMASARHKELIADKDFGARYLAGGEKSREGRELDALRRHSLGMDQSAASQPPSAFSVPAGFTPAMAKARIDELLTDKEFGKRYLSGDKRAAAELDALQRHSLGIDQPTVPQEPSPAPGEQPPPRPENYNLHRLPPQMNDDQRAELTEMKGVAHAAGLPQPWFEMASRQAEVDANRYNGWADDAIADDVDGRLRRHFGADYDRCNEGARAIAGEIEAKHPGTLEKLRRAGLARNMALLTWLMQRGRERTQR
jgi:hypothetical protein